MHPADCGTGRGLIICTVRARHQLSVPRRQLMFCINILLTLLFQKISWKYYFFNLSICIMKKKHHKLMSNLFRKVFCSSNFQAWNRFEFGSKGCFHLFIAETYISFLGAWDGCQRFDTKFDTCLCLQHHRGTILPSHTWCHGFCDECDLSKEIETSWRGAVWWFYMWKIDIVILLLGRWDSQM